MMFARPIVAEARTDEPAAGRTWALARSAWLAAALALAVLLRASLDRGGAQSAFAAGAAFGMALVVLAARAGRAGFRLRLPTPGQVALGIAAGTMLAVLPGLLRSGPSIATGIRPEPFLTWMIVTCLVAAGEEAVLRGALFDALRAGAGVAAAVVLTSAAFALLHVPLYGWHVVPLDLAVGLGLGGLRLVSGGIAAPAVAHAVADLATWWL
jgi:membrane protease YdiL (CAAX protease family)